MALLTKKKKKVPAIAAIKPATPAGTPNAKNLVAQTRGFDAPTDRVEDYAADIMAQDSPLMQKARTSGMQFAASRGLTNSSMAGQAMQSAVLDQVVPMASQNAGQAFQKNMSSQDYLEGRGLASQDASLRGGLLETESDLRRIEAGEDRKFQTGILNKEQSFTASQTAKDQAFKAAQAGKDRNQTARQAQLDRTSTARQAQLDRTASLKLNQMETSLRTNLAKMDLSAGDRRGAEAAFSNASNDYQDQYRSIMSNPDLKSEDRNAALASAARMLETRTNYLQKLYGNVFNFPANPFKTK